MDKIIIIIITSCTASLFYRCGGMSKELSTKPKWIPVWMRNTRVRDIGCSAVTCLLASYLLSWHWTLILVFGATWGAMTTYWKRGPNAKWYNWLMTGAMYSVATLPFIIAEGHWIGFASRTIVLASLTMIWSELNGNAVREELGRGFIITATIPLLLI